MNLKTAQTLVAWLWDQHPQIIDALVKQVPRSLGQCVSCDIDWLSQSTCFGTGGASGLIDPTVSLDPVSLDSSLTNPTFCLDPSCLASSTSGFSLQCIPTLSESDLAPIDTSAVTGPTCTVGTGTSVTNTDANTSSALSGVASFLTSAAGLNALTKVATSYLQAQTASSNAKAAQSQAAILQAQLSRAVSNQSALPIAYVANGATGTTTPVIKTTGGYVPLTGSTLSALTPAAITSFFAQYGSWILIGGAAAFLLYAASRRRSTSP